MSMQPFGLNRSGQTGPSCRANNVMQATAKGAPPRGPAHIVERTLTPLSRQYFSVNLIIFAPRGASCGASASTRACPFANGRPLVAKSNTRFQTVSASFAIENGTENGASIAAYLEKAFAKNRESRLKGCSVPGSCC